MRPLERRDVEPFPRPGVSRLPEPAAERGVFEEALDRGSEARRVPGRDEEAGLAVDDRLGDAADVGCDDRKAGGHGLEDRHREALGGTGQDEEVGAGEDLRNVVPRAGELDRSLETEAANLGFDQGPIGPGADEDGLEASLREPGEGPHQRERVLGGLEPAHGDDPRRTGVGMDRLGRGSRVDAVVDDDRVLRAAGTGGDPGDALALGDADRHRRQRPDEPVGPEVDARATSLVRGERPPVDGEDADRHTGEPGGDSPEDAGLRAARVEDVRTLASQEHQELEQAEQVAPGADRPPDMPESDEPNAGGTRGIPQRPRTVRRERDVEAPGERGQKRRDVCLRPSQLRERHHEEDARPPPLAHAGKRTSPFRTRLVPGTGRVLPSRGRCLAPRRRLGALPFGILGVGVFLWWAAADGGYAPTVWYPGALVFLVVLAFVAIGAARQTIATRPAAPAIALLAAFAIWSFLSIGWADVKGDAWDGANRTLLYASVFAVFALPRWRPGEAAGLLALFSVGAAAIGAAVLASDGASAFVGDRLASPIEYANGNAAFFLIALWPAVALAARPELHPLARGVLLAAAGVNLQLAILAQSRAALVAGSAALALYVVLAPARLRALLALVPVGAVTLASLPPLLDVYASSSASELESAIARERQVLAASAAVLLVTGVVLGALDRRRAGRGLALATRGRLLAVAGVVAGALLVAIAAGAAVAIAQEPAGAASSRFTGGLESGRYDLWRVATEEFARHPFLGVGVDNFTVDHVRERETDEELLYPHSVLLRAASQTGLAGAGLFVGFLAAAAGAAVRLRRQHDALGGAIASAGVVAAAYWLVHGSADWLWELPALTGPALASLGLACGLADPSDGAGRARRPRRAAVAGLIAAAVGLAGMSYALPALSAFQVERAVDAWPEEPARAFSRLERARQLNVLSERPDVIAGVLAHRAGRPTEARRAFERALERNRHDWYIHLRLAFSAAAAREGQSASRAAERERTRARLAYLQRARALNPRERVIELAERTIRSGRPPEPQLVARIDALVVRAPLGRRPLSCRPVLGMGARCPG
jgi:tetratricopeptide (TPR) repeat protein